MYRIGMFALLAAAVCLAQSQAPATQPESAAPPEVNQALRDRVAKFYQAQVDRKYRQAEQYVAEETKDYYYNMQKSVYLNFEIKTVTYSDNFTHASVAVQADREAMTPFGKMTFHMPDTSEWRLENGQWGWYVDPNVISTPFGTTKRTQPAPAGDAPRTPMGSQQPVTIGDLRNKVTADKNEIHLPAKGGTSEVTIKNALPGTVTLSLELPETPGLTAKLAPTNVPQNGSARVVFAYAPQTKLPAGVTARVSVSPLNQTIPIRIAFEP